MKSYGGWQSTATAVNLATVLFYSDTIPHVMLFLLANIFFGSLFGLIIKWVENRKSEDIITVGMINYVVAAILGLPELLGVASVEYTTWAVVTGTSMGASYFIAFFFCVFGVRWIGVSSTTVISILSICVPILVAMLVWSEQPSRYQWLGIGLALLSLSLIGRNGDKVNHGQVAKKPWFVPLIMVFFFVLCGCSRLAQQAFRNLCEESERPVFLISAFLIAAIPSIALLIFRSKKITLVECILGSLLGMSNILQTHFILKALKVYEGFIVFPIASAGGLMLVTLVATSLMGEQLGRWSYLGIGIACLSLVFLYWLPN